MARDSQLADMMDELDFESWLDVEGVQYKLTRGTSGTQANIRACPCCGNTKWKTYVNIETGLGNCFVCEEKFTKWKFIARHLNVSNADVFQHIKRFMESQGFRPNPTAHYVAPKPSLIIPDSLPIPINGRNLRYLQDRGVSIELAEQFGLRYCHEGKFVFVDPSGRPAEQKYDRRIIIPILDMDGKLVSFQGRDITGTQEPKYLFPPGFASTGSVIYNGHAIKGRKRLVMGEGVFDCIAIEAAIRQDQSMNGIGAVASFGKKLSFDQIEKLRELQKSGLEEIIFMWDAEKAALSAAVDAAVECKSKGLSCSIALLPPGLDPNEVEPEVVREAIWKATQITSQSAIRLKLAARRL